jgi:hypothetical protein
MDYRHDQFSAGWWRAGSQLGRACPPVGSLKAEPSAALRGAAVSVGAKPA